MNQVKNGYLVNGFENIILSKMVMAKPNSSSLMKFMMRKIMKKDLRDKILVVFLWFSKVCFKRVYKKLGIVGEKLKVKIQTYKAHI